MRKQLGHYNGLRALLFFSGGIAAGLGQQWGLLLGAAAMLWFLLQAILSLAQAKIFQRGKP